MATEVILPKLGMNAETAKIVRWLKHEGEHVAVGEVLAEIETDKTVFGLEAEVAGVLRWALASEDEPVAMTQTIALIGDRDEDVSAQIQRISAPAPKAPSHVHRAYDSMRERGGADGLTERGARRAPSADGQDPNEIRARLAARGLLDSGPRDVPRRGRPLPTFRRKLAIYGAGLGAKQLLEVTRHLDDLEVVALIDDNPDIVGTLRLGVPVRGGMSTLADLIGRGEVDCVALSFHSEVRRKIHQRLARELGIHLTPLVDPRAIIGMDVEIGEGALIEAGTVVGPGTVVGEGVIVDVGAVVAHDCFLGPFSHLSPGCRLSGVVHLTEDVLVGVGAAINSTVTVGRCVIIAPNSAVMNDVPDGVVMSGVPARVIGQSRRGGEQK